MKKIYFLIPVALFLFSWSCQQDSTDILTPEQEQEAAMYDAAAYLLSGLLDSEVTPEQIDELKKQNLEPAYGLVTDESNSFERTVIVDNSDRAEAAFCGLAGWSESVLSQTAEGYMINLTAIGMGSLEFFFEGDGSNVGYASVDIPCIPHLQRITYKTRDQVGENSSIELYQSPYHYGEVFLHDGRYYICTREATGFNKSSSGILVCMESGRGSNFEYYMNSEKWGCWKPKQSWTDSDFIDSYLLLCSDPMFTREKSQIVSAWPGKVFPKVQRWKEYDTAVDVGDETWGFGALIPNYSHVTRFHDDLTQEKSHSDKKVKDWKDCRVVVFRDATEGDYRWKKAKWYRRAHHYVLPFVCKLDKGIYADTKKYTSKGEWKDFFDASPVVYTMNAIRFYDVPLTGYTLMDPWAK